MADAVQYTFQRYEQKYRITSVQQTRLLRALEEYMVPDDYGQYSICNIYYDTPDWQLIRHSLEKPCYKEKLRLRSYGTPGEEDPVFLEIKKKVEGMVYKRRTQLPSAAAPRYLAGDETLSPGDQVSREIDWFQYLYHSVPRVFLAYDRVALAGREEPGLRITFDRQLRWRDRELDLAAGDWGAPLLPEDAVLMEIKLPGRAPFWLSRLLGELEIYPISFSKYGYCYQHYLRKNTFQEEFHSA